MMKVLLAFLCFGQLLVMAQEPVRVLDVEIRGFTSPGYLIAAPLQQDTLMLVDDYGRPLFQTRVGLHTNAQVYNDRFVTYFAGGGRNRCFVRRDHLLRPIDTFMIKGPGYVDFHEGKVWTDTSFLVLGSEQVQMDLSDSIPGGKSDVTVIAGVIQEQTFDGTVVFEWRTLDHIAFSDATVDVDLTQNFIDHAHINAVWRDLDGNLLVSCRHTDEILKIDRATGDIIWRLGGSASRHREFEFVNDTLDGFFGFSHQHSVCRTSRGTLLMLDNGNLKPVPQKSRVVEYEVDESAHTARKVWEFDLELQDFIKSMGSVQELPNGNILVGYGNDEGPVIAQEIRRETGVVATFRSIADRANNPFRAQKTTIGMVGIIDTIAQAGIITFADRDSTTGVSFLIDTIASDVVVAAERHHIVPPEPAFGTDGPDHLLPMRLSIRYLGGDTSWQKLSGLTTIDASILPRGIRPEEVTWYVRDTIGRGPFRPLEVTLDQDARVVSTSGIARGEIIAGIDSLSAPELLSPLPGEQVPPALCEFRVRLSESVGQCEFTILHEDGTTPILRRRVFADSNGVAVWYCDSLQPGWNYTWQCAEIGSIRAGRPSDLRRITTGSSRREKPVPEALESTMNVSPGENDIRWTSDEDSRTIVQWISPKPSDGIGVCFEQAATDTLEAGVFSAAVVVSDQGASVYWRAASLGKDGSLSWSDTVGFCTSPGAGQGMVPIMPSIGQRNVPTSGATFRFTTSLQHYQYQVLLSKGRGYAPLSRQTADMAGVVTFDSLEPHTRYFWRVVGKTTFADTGALGMFTTGEQTQTTRVTESNQKGLLIECHGGELRIEAPFPIASVRLVDEVGRAADSRLAYADSDQQRCLVQLPTEMPPVFGVSISDGMQTTIYRWVMWDK